jgi:hypothetical protein
MMGDYCWRLHPEIPENSPKRNINICTFAGKIKR